jgi:hypothetical protein
MQNLPFIVAGWGVILGGAGLYSVLLLRRLAVARRASLLIRRQAESTPPPDQPA